MEFQHVSVLPREVLQQMHLQEGGIYVDCTLGGAGHASSILSALQGQCHYIGIDQDKDALAFAKKRLAPYAKSVTLVQDNFSHLQHILASLHISAVNGILFDLGVSSFQLDEIERGFSYMHDAPLDMRMNQESGQNARDLVNQASMEELNRIFWTYGEERWAKRIAQFIVEERKQKAIETTGELVAVIKKAVPKGARQEKQHPAKRTFQAIRIAVNEELTVLEKALSQSVECLKPGGRICVITFHSLEDRIVKDFFRQEAKGCTCPPEIPICVCGKKPRLEIITKRPIVPDAEEIEENPRARSAKLRVAARVLKEKEEA